MRTSRTLIAALGLAALLGAGTAAGPVWADDENGTSYSNGYDNNESKKPKKGAVPAVPACADFVFGGGSTDANLDGVADDLGFTADLAGPVCGDVVYELTIRDANGTRTETSNLVEGEQTVGWLYPVTGIGAQSCVFVSGRTLVAGAVADSAPEDGLVELEVCDGSPGSISWR